MKESLICSSNNTPSPPTLTLTPYTPPHQLTELALATVPTTVIYNPSEEETTAKIPFATTAMELVIKPTLVRRGGSKTLIMTNVSRVISSTELDTTLLPVLNAVLKIIGTSLAITSQKNNQSSNSAPLNGPAAAEFPVCGTPQPSINHFWTSVSAVGSDQILTHGVCHNHTVNLFIDSGSSVSLFSNTFIKRLKITSSITPTQKETIILERNNNETIVSF